ncbi:MAG: DUF308 domain-containing protein [Sphingomonadales bacterium]|nr:DUF308 domain-containing protein [Sphingomonadales bacterium]
MQDALPTRNWGWFALRGVLAIALGVGALLLPAAALFAFATIFAAYSFVDGVFALASGIRGARSREERWGMLVLSGLAGIAVGVIFLFFPLLGTVAYAVLAVVMVAVWAILTGALEIAAAWRLRRVMTGEWLLILSGALSVLLGLFLIVMLWTAPRVTLLSVAWLIGIYALAAGVVLLVLAFRLRRHGRAA